MDGGIFDCPLRLALPEGMSRWNFGLVQSMATTRTRQDIFIHKSVHTSLRQVIWNKKDAIHNLKDPIRATLQPEKRKGG